MRRAVVLSAVLTCAAAAAPSSLAAGRDQQSRSARANASIEGEVLVCNGPGRCFERTFEVAAINGAGKVAAHTLTSGPGNRYRLRVPAGRYSLVANSNGLRCSSSAQALAHRTVIADITCPVP